MTEFRWGLFVALTLTDFGRYISSPLINGDMAGVIAGIVTVPLFAVIQFVMIRYLAPPQLRQAAPGEP